MKIIVLNSYVWLTDSGLMWEFDLDLGMSQHIPRESLWPLYRAKYSTDFKEIAFSFDEDPAQQKSAQDFEHRLADGRTLIIEEKIRFFRKGIYYDDILVEVQHVGALSGPGWIEKLHTKHPYTNLAYVRMLDGRPHDMDIVNPVILKELAGVKMDDSFLRCACANRYLLDLQTGRRPVAYCRACGSIMSSTNRGGKVWVTRNVGIDRADIAARGGFDLRCEQKRFGEW